MTMDAGRARKDASLTDDDDQAVGDSPVSAADDEFEEIEVAHNPEHVGSALRSAYQSIMSEAIPDEMLDLLNKLG